MWPDAEPTIRLMEGDCLERMKEIASGSVDLILCDLPYGTTQNKWDSVLDLPSLWKEYQRICTGATVLTAAQPFTSALVTSNLPEFKYSWVWRKEQGTGILNAKKQPLRDAEDVLVFYRSQPTYNPQMRQGFKPYVQKQGGVGSNYGKVKEDIVTVNDGTRYPLTTLEFKRDKDKVHPTQKPVALMEYLIRTYTDAGMTVLDNCMGSGTTGVACVNTGRNFIGIEKDPAYFEIARKRILYPDSPVAARKTPGLARPKVDPTREPAHTYAATSLFA